jgi:hypothetical protein
VSKSNSAFMRLPLFMAYCSDALNVLSKRLEVRPAHLRRWSQDRATGRGREPFSCFLLPHMTAFTQSTAIGYKQFPSSTPSLFESPKGISPMVGLYRFSSLNCSRLPGRGSTALLILLLASGSGQGSQLTSLLIRRWILVTQRTKRKSAEERRKWTRVCDESGHEYANRRHRHCIQVAYGQQVLSRAPPKTI